MAGPVFKKNEETATVVVVFGLLTCHNLVFVYANKRLVRDEKSD